MSRGPQIVIVVLLIGVVALGGLLVTRGRHTQPSSSDVIVYAPCGMTSPIGAAARLFRESHPDLQLNIVYHNAIVLVRRIRGGDRPDIFISPGELEMRQMVEEGYVDPDTVRDFGTLDLVVFAPRTTQDLNAIDDLKKPHIKRIALAHPDYNSVGYYGKEALKSLGLWDSLAGKIFQREYPLEAVTLVTSGQVDAGITYLTCPLDTAPDKADKSAVRIVAKIPRDAYPPVRCQLGTLRDSKRRALAQQFIDFMLSDQAQRAVAANGLCPAEEIQ